MEDQPRCSTLPRRWADEDGYVIPQMALLLIPLIIFAALATDVGAWYLHAQKIQRAADAAALGGVAFLPNEDAALNHIAEVAARNGYTEGTVGTQIEVDFFGANRLEVEITAQSEAFFGRIVFDGIEITRYARAERVDPIRMGNPTSALGTGNLTEGEIGPGLQGDGVWLAFGAYCEPRSNGNGFGAGGISTDRGEGNFCTPTPNMIPNPNYAAANGFIFVVETQAGSGAIDIQVREPGSPCGIDNPDFQEGFSEIGGIHPVIIFEVYGPNPNTDHQAFVDGNAPIQTIAFPRDACNGWYDLATGLPSLGNEGHYYVKAYTRGPGTTAIGEGTYQEEGAFNTVSLRVTPSGTNGGCIFSNLNPTCPKLSALEWFPVFSNSTGDDELYLAEVAENFAGGTLTVVFFDAAEGITGMQFVGPNDIPVNYEWRYADVSVGGVGGYEYLETDFVPVGSTCAWNGTAPGPCLDTSNRDDWNDHYVEVRIEVPPDYACNGDDCWWKIRFSASGGERSNDRSSWTIFADGDPIRLIE